jgi:hypothetical protein
MAMTVIDFYNRVKSISMLDTKSRVLIVRNRQEQKELRQLFDERPKQFAWVRFSKCVTAEAFIPPADQVFIQIRSAIVAANAEDRVAYVTGLSAMLEVWDSVERASAFDQLRKLIDDTNLKFYVFTNDVHKDEMQIAFSHPRYEEGRSLLVVGERTNEDGVPEIRLVSPRIYNYMTGESKSSLSTYLNDFEIGGFGSRVINIRIDAYSHTLAAVGGAIKQVFRAGDYLRLFANYQGGLTEPTEEWLFSKMVEGARCAAAKDFIQDYFFRGNAHDILQDGPRMICEHKDSEQEALVWMLKQSVPSNSYLSKVLYHPRFATKRFKQIYVNEAIEQIGVPEEHALCKERQEGIATILKNDSVSLDAEIAEFIEATKGVDAYQIIPWLTNRTDLEINECIRRLREADLKTIPSAFYDAVPLLKDYLEPYALGNADLEVYFTDYRTHKVANKIDLDFYQKAKEVQYPIMGIKSRDDLLNDSSLKDAALLVVDAMGVEYLPMIISLSHRYYDVDIANAIPAMVRIPTSTKFNKIDWPSNLRLDGIPELDTIIHNGAHMHGTSTDEENFHALLKVFQRTIMPRIVKAIAEYGKVILTADHGASRLAVLANKTNLTQRLQVKGIDDKAEDWRYLVADKNSIPPPFVASNITGDYWVVKGYDKFSKSGGKLNELHGGLTYEEVLVPFVVFEKGASFTPTKATNVPQTQFIENDDFDL